MELLRFKGAIRRAAFAAVFPSQFHVAHELASARKRVESQNMTAATT
jgi:hypothetical protein